MGAAYFIVLEQKIDGLDTGMDGKRISQHIDALDAAARESGVKPLSEFLSIAPEAASQFIEGEGLDVSDMKLPAVQQFTAEEGLKLFKHWPHILWRKRLESPTICVSASAYWLRRRSMASAGILRWIFEPNGFGQLTSNDARADGFPGRIAH